MKRIILIILLTIITVHAETWIYISPGIRLNYNEVTGFEFSLQITNGYISESLGKNIPGITIGAIWNKNYHGFYSDLQLGRPGFFDLYTIFKTDYLAPPLFSGFGIGKLILIYDKDKYSKRKRYYNKVKLWAGCFGLASYEYRWSNKYKNYHNWGIMGIFPLPASNNWTM